MNSNKLYFEIFEEFEKASGQKKQSRSSTQIWN